MNFVTDNQRRRVSLAAVVLAVTLTALIGCSEPATDPEQQLRVWAEQGQAAVEEKQRRALIDMISPAYVDAKGYDRDDLDNMLRAYFLRQHSISLITAIREIQVFGDSAAEIEMTVGMAGTNDGVLGISADVYHFSLELQRDDDDWRLISAKWGQLGGEVH